MPADFEPDTVARVARGREEHSAPPPRTAPPLAADEAAAGDTALMLRARDGDVEAFGALYDRWSGPVFRWLLGRCRDRAAAEDLMHETFLRSWRAAPRWEPRARVSTWLFQIAKNLWINRHAKAVRRGPHLSLEAPRGGEDGPTLGGRLAGPSPDPSHVARQHEIGHRIRLAVDELSDKLRDVFVLAVFEERPYAEIAAALGIPEGTVKSRMYAAYRQLRDRLEDLA